MTIDHVSFICYCIEWLWLFQILEDVKSIFYDILLLLRNRTKRGITSVESDAYRFLFGAKKMEFGVSGFMSLLLVKMRFSVHCVYSNANNTQNENRHYHNILLVIHRFIEICAKKPTSSFGFA